MDCDVEVASDRIRPRDGNGESRIEEEKEDCQVKVVDGSSGVQGVVRGRGSRNKVRIIEAIERRW